LGILYKRLSRLPNYIKRFGPFDGFRLLFQVERILLKTSETLRKYRFHGHPGPVYLRETISDHSIFWQCIVRRQYDMHRFHQSDRLARVYREQVQRGISPLIIDCGGNIGLATLDLATLFPEATIYVIEPDEANLEILKLNTSYFGKRVVPLKGGIWNESGILRIINPEAGSSAFRVSTTTDHSDGALQAYTINDICRLAGVEFPFIVKIDIEGAQANLFKNNTRWVQNTHLIMLELDDWLMPWRGTSRPFFSCISQYPFDYLISGETIFCFRDYEVRNGAQTF